MKKIFITASLVASSAIFAQQYDGKVGVNTDTPAATLDLRVAAANTTTPEGLLIPRVSRTRLNAMTSGTNTASSVIASTMIYVDTVDGNTNTQTVNVDAVGFYYYNGTVWVKMGAGSGSTAANLAPATGSIRTVSGMTAAQWTATDFAIIIPNGAPASFGFPDPVANANRILSVRNNQGGLVTFTENAPLNNTTISTNRGMIVMSDGVRWHVIAGF